jgi:predicted amino acid-binding ACT domain protein
MDFLEKIRQMPESVRTAFMSDNADEVMADQFYRVSLTEEQQADAERKHMEMSIESAKLKEEFSRMKKEYQRKQKELGVDINAEMQKVRLGAEERKGTLYYFKDQDSGTMFTVDEEGELVGKRPLTNKERQGTLMAAIRNTGTEGGSNG